ncbi:hydroxyacylglutathione hydrolase C-terminal domain-containing protein [Bartonella queenslandensis]|uniref:hydroxyacylglutathione hydrolase C-terminal domain-containing protein n=1 Tax=Bartonella queenslandensis TaxID=481138 RepID=UPI0002FE5E21
MRAKNSHDSLPVTLGQEKETNPFLRWDNYAIRKKLSMKNATDEEIFAEIRKRKDNF